MKTESETSLRNAKRNLGDGISILAAREVSIGTLSSSEKELMLAMGTARDWLRWAAGMQDIEFRKKNDQESGRKEGIVESMRFSQIWTAANALFARHAVLQLFGPISANAPELEKFRFLHQNSNIAATVEARAMSVLWSLLDMECNTKDVTPILGLAPVSEGKVRVAPTPYPTMWEVVYSKYCRPVDQGRGIGKVIGDALAIPALPRPDAPTLIYGARNWAVHGMLLTSFFRGSKRKFPTFIDNIVLLLSSILEGFSAELKLKV